MSFLFGKPAKSESKNLAYPWISRTFGNDSRELVNQGQSVLSNYIAMLNGSDGGAGFDTYKTTTGYNNIFDEAMRGVTGSAAARGLLGSGATLRATQDRAGQLAQQNYANYLGQLLQGSQVGLNAGTNLASLIAGAGQTSKSTGGTPGLLGSLGAIGQLGSGIGAITAPGALFGPKAGG